MMGENQQNILLSELSSAASYLDRIFRVLSKINNFTSNNILEKFRQDLFILFESKNSLITMEGSQNCSIDDIQNAINFFKFFLKLPFKRVHKLEWGPEFINILYGYAHQLHLACLEYGPTEIDLPRVNILTCQEKEGIPFFSLGVDDIGNSGHCLILSLEEKRKKKYAEFIHLGNEAIIYKQVMKAKDFFSKAINLKETPEALTLLAWVQSLLGNTDDAKALCHKAIEIDPSYGPPYNDLGIFLMEEGSFEKSLKWFEKAKRSINYQNREYPYINSGRVYMKVKKYDQALKELQMALTLVPTHQALHKTVERLIRKIPELSRKNV
ncbi:MAG: hypothetical protein E2O68_07740 [Deltaproteobacteria bacterium]|nr:MAG: hypothetical protein E2O68_07740 [Deltaproteobacteria bacterium]